MKNKEVVLWENHDPEWIENDETEKVVAVRVPYSDGREVISIRCDTSWGFVDWPKDYGYGVKWDFPERFSEECRGAAVVAYRSLQEFEGLRQKFFHSSRFVVLPEDRAEQERYDNLLGLFYPEYRNDQWINYLEVEGR